jgi:AI-2 transport protein TqsA
MLNDPLQTGFRGMAAALAIVAAILVFAALASAESVFAPLAFALFIVALAWPLQRWLQLRLPMLAALAGTMLVVVGVVLFLSAATVWAFGNVTRWFIAEAPRLQLIYSKKIEWFDQNGIAVAGFVGDQFNSAWLIRLLQEFAKRLNTTLSFCIVTFVYALLGLLEVDDVQSKLQRLEPDFGHRLIQAASETSSNLQKYMRVRTIMSLLTGVLVWALVGLAGLDLAVEWGVIAFVLNYIPFIGPFVATLLPTVFAAAQFESWQVAVAIFVCLNLIQFFVGSYLEPRIAGKVLSISPFVVLFTVFFWSYLWGIAGAFIGIPIVVAALAILRQFPSCRWMIVILSGPQQHSSPGQ